MARSLPVLGLALCLILAGCLGGFGFGGSSETPTTTTTIKINHDGTTQIVELIGVSIPENGTIQKQALRYTKSQLDHQVVTVVTDPRVDTPDDGHLQAYVYIGNFMVNTDLVRIGYARMPDTNFSKRQQFMSNQQQAKQNGYGRWNTTTTAA
jgi:endonuclease YncB( thermonuclease family)